MTINREFERYLDRWLEAVAESKFQLDRLLDKNISTKPIDHLIYSSSHRVCDGSAYFLLKIKGGALGILSGKLTNTDFTGIRRNIGSLSLLCCSLDHSNAECMRRTFSFTKPSTLRNARTVFGVGDRLGIAGPGHVRTFKKFQASPVYAQQSVRELNLTNRNHEDVLDSSTWAVFQEGYTQPWGADGDHLKTVDWVKKTLSIGFTMITADVSDYIKNIYGKKSAADIDGAYHKLDPDYRQTIEDRYLNRTFELDTGEGIKMSSETLKRSVLIYSEALIYAEQIFREVSAVQKVREIDFELSVDETDIPTTPQAHIFIALEAKRMGMRLDSVAPRFVGEFQKGIDYIGNTDEFEQSFKTHAAIARMFGYKISVHSGSDKFTVFPIIGKQTEGTFLVKTAGTSWLESLAVIAIHEPKLFSDIYKHALKTFDRATRYYHITPDLGNVPDISPIPQNQFPDLLKNPDIRQVLHVTYGEMHANTQLTERFFRALRSHIEEYWQYLDAHIGKHLQLLGVDHSPSET